jgi:hypothetical protein
MVKPEILLRVPEELARAAVAATVNPSAALINPRRESVILPAFPPPLSLSRLVSGGDDGVNRGAHDLTTM